jgi:hypothetical protein
MVLAGCVLIVALTPGISARQITLFSLSLMLSLFVIPLLFVPIVWLYAKITQLEFSEKQKRLALLFPTSLVYFFTAYHVSAHNPLLLINAYIMACSVLMALAFCVSIFWRISLHAIGVGGFLALVIQLSVYEYFFAFTLIPAALVVAGLVLSARLYVQAHTVLQVLVGCALGMAVVFFFT